MSDSPGLLTDTRPLPAEDTLGCLEDTVNGNSRVFEFPCNERIRILMRVDCMARRIRYFSEKSSQFEHEACLHALFELYELLSSRGDIKNELLQELDRQRAQLNRFIDQPGVSNDRLHEVLGEIGSSHTSLAEVPVRLGPHLAEFEFLQGLKGRVGIPAGSCPFDMPSYFVWLHRPVQVRKASLDAWVSPLAPLMDATALCLRILRDGAEPASYQANQGVFELNPEGRLARLIRVRIPPDPELVCEVSANKYVVAVRFRALDEQLRPKPIEGRVDFDLTLCDF
jgi:cell division protein ZapD